MAEYIDRKAVMDAFAQRVTRSNNSDFAPAPAWNSAVEIVEQFPAADVAKQDWIPVTERLPEQRINPHTHDFEYVLCATIWGDVRPFKYGTPLGQKEAHFWNGAGYVDAYITHWMPLPKPPEEDGT